MWMSEKHLDISLHFAADLPIFSGMLLPVQHPYRGNSNTQLEVCFIMLYYLQAQSLEKDESWCFWFVF